MSQEDEEMGQWLDPPTSKQDSNVMYFSVEYDHGQDISNTNGGESFRTTQTSTVNSSYILGEQTNTFVDINDTDFTTTESLGISSTSPHLDTNCLYSTSSNHTVPQYRQLSVEGLPGSGFGTQEFLLSEEQCSELFKPGAKLVLLPNSGIPYQVIEPFNKSVTINVQESGDLLNVIRPQSPSLHADLGQHSLGVAVDKHAHLDHADIHVLQNFNDLERPVDEKRSYAPLNVPEERNISVHATFDEQSLHSNTKVKDSYTDEEERALNLFYEKRGLLARTQKRNAYLSDVRDNKEKRDSFLRSPTKMLHLANEEQDFYLKNKIRDPQLNHGGRDNDERTLYNELRDNHDYYREITDDSLHLMDEKQASYLNQTRQESDPHHTERDMYIQSDYQDLHLNHDDRNLHGNIKYRELELSVRDRELYFSNDQRMLQVHSDEREVHVTQDVRMLDSNSDERRLQNMDVNERALHLMRDERLLHMANVERLLQVNNHERTDMDIVHMINEDRVTNFDCENRIISEDRLLQILRDERLSQLNSEERLLETDNDERILHLNRDERTTLPMDVSERVLQFEIDNRSLQASSEARDIQLGKENRTLEDDNEEDRNLFLYYEKRGLHVNSQGRSLRLNNEDKSLQPNTTGRVFHSVLIDRGEENVEKQGMHTTSTPLDCSTSLCEVKSSESVTLDNKLEEIRMVEESLEGDHLEPSLLDDGLLARLNTECLMSICDKPVPSRAKATLPAAFLQLIPTRDNRGERIVAKRKIPQFTRFGPLEGVVSKENLTKFDLREMKNSGFYDNQELIFIVEFDTDQFRQLDVSNEGFTNWMKFVRPARNVEDQNLALHQKGDALFFTTIKEIWIKQELKVWYAKDYALQRHLPLLQTKYTSLDRTEKCPHCDNYFAKEELRPHIITIHNAPCQLSGKAKLTGEEENENSESVNFYQKKVRISERLTSKRFQNGGWGIHKDINKKEQCNAEEVSVRSSIKAKKSYECSTCRKAFPKDFNLKRHILSHLTELNYPCHLCKKNFKQEIYRENHINNIHAKENGGVSESHSTTSIVDSIALNCEKCQLEFPEFTSFLIHLDSHFDSIRYDENGQVVHSCHFCTQTFDTRDILLSHMFAHGEKHFRFICERCKRIFSSKEAFQKHVENDPALPYQCTTCCKKFHSAMSLACHDRTHAGGGLSFECPMCLEKFHSLKYLKSHVKEHQVNGLYECPRCSKKYTEYHLIRKHIRTFHSGKKFDCQICYKPFPSKDKLRMHMLSHSDHREFLCSHCGKQFKRKDKLKEHVIRIHNPNNMRKESDVSTTKHMKKYETTPIIQHNTMIKKSNETMKADINRRAEYERCMYKCHPCMYGFKRRGMLVNHLANRHPEINPDTVPELNVPIVKESRDYYCQYCDKIYKSSSKRKSHILKNHPGRALPLSSYRLKPQCSTDSDDLPNSAFCQTTGSIATLPHGCQWCHKQYASKAKLLQHQRGKHSAQLPPNLKVPRLSKQSSSEDDSRSGIPQSSSMNTQPVVSLISNLEIHSSSLLLPTVSSQGTSTGLASTPVDIAPLQFDPKVAVDNFELSATAIYSDAMNMKPNSYTKSHRPKLVKQGKVDEKEPIGDRVQELVELPKADIILQTTGGLEIPEVYEVTTEICPETLELLKKQFKMDSGTEFLGQALEEYVGGKALSTENLLKLIALNGVTIVTEPVDTTTLPVNSTTNFVYPTYPPR